MALGLAFGVVLTPRSAVALDNSKSLSQYNCRTWTRQTGLPVNRIRSLAQSEDGYLWLGTRMGLIRFDGIEFEVNQLPEHQQWHNRVPASLRRLNSGEMCFGFEAGGLGFWSKAKGFVLPAKEWWMIPNMGVNCIFEASDGAIWAGTAFGATRWFPGDTNRTSFITDALNTLSFHEDPQGRVWIGTADRGLLVWENGSVRTFSDPNLANQSIHCIASDTQSNLWVGTQFGLRCFDSHLRPRFGTHIYSEVRAFYTDRQGALWIGTSGDGLARFYKGNLQLLRQTNGLADDFVTAITEDREGSIWIGTREGLSQLSDVKFPIYTGDDGTLGGYTHGVYAGKKGGVWVASNRGLSWFDEAGNSRKLTVDDGLSSAYIKRVCETRNGDVYLINANREIEVIAGDKVIARHPFRSWPTALAEDSDGVIASVGHELYRINRSQLALVSFTNSPSPAFYWIRNLLTCADGSILVSSANGVFRIRGNAVEKHWSIEAGFSEADTHFACEDEEGTIWVGQPGGLARIRDDKVVLVKDPLTDAAVNAIAPDHWGYLWIATSKGFARLNRQSANNLADGRTDHLAGTLFDGLDSIKTIESTEVEYVVCQTTDRNIWFPTPQGPARMRPDKIPFNSLQPSVEIQSVLINGERFQPGTANRLKPGSDELAFQFTGISLHAPQKVRFRYKLEGYDQDWVEAGPRRSALYANLKPQTYTFRVVACNADGVWNEAGDSVQITLPPHFYQTAWFQFLAALLCAASLGGIYAWRVKHLRHKQRSLQQANELLETRILERTQELSEQRNLLRTLIDHLPDDVFVKDADGRVIINNLAHARTMGLNDPQLAIGKTDFDCYPAEQAESFRKAEQALLSTGVQYNAEEYVVLKNGNPRWQRTTKVPLRDGNGQIIGLAGIQRDITERKKWETQLETLHKQLLDSSRQAGMAEVATSVLHNVGNVLNSVNVSASIVEDQTRNSGLDKLEKVVTLLQQNRSNLAEFLTSNDKGGKLVHYLETLHRTMLNERARILTETESLTRNVEHIKKIVAMQQSYARVSGLTEVVKPSELIEDALRMHETAYQRHSICIVREFHDVPALSVDRHKVIQILVNLLQNAKYACDVNEAGNRVVTLRIAPGEAGWVRIAVIDNGMGILPENLTRIFSYGFTTRKNGHGFGLHSGALAAKEMGGSLIVQSEGPGKGASFVLELPIEAKNPSPNGHTEQFRKRTLERSLPV